MKNKVPHDDERTQLRAESGIIRRRSMLSGVAVLTSMRFSDASGPATYFPGVAGVVVESQVQSGADDSVLSTQRSQCKYTRTRCERLGPQDETATVASEQSPIYS